MSDPDRVKVDAIVVGGGPAGLAAALAMVGQGLEVIVVERGAYAGAKNVGGLFYGTVLAELLPGFAERAPIERTVSRREIVYLGEGQHAGVGFGADAWGRPPFNNTFVVFRSRFDRWLAKETEEAGASLLEGTVVDELLYEGSGDGTARRRGAGPGRRGRRGVPRRRRGPRRGRERPPDRESPGRARPRGGADEAGIRPWC